MQLQVEWVPIEEIRPNPRNRNNHSVEQISRLSEIIRYQGFRNPLIISKRTGLMVAGHGRLLAAKELKLEKVPVLYQDFESEEQEYAAGISDNSIASWSELDLSGINHDIPELGPDFNLDLLGLRGFELEPADKFVAQEHWSEMPEFEEMKDQHQAVVIFDDIERKNEFLELIDVKDYKKFRDGKLWSMHWPQKK